MTGLNLGTKAEPELGTGIANGATSSQKIESVENGGVARWSSHPIQRYSVGNYSFTGGLLTLPAGEEAEKFKRLLLELPLSEQTRIKEIDLKVAEMISREALATSGGATKTIDSSVGDRAGSPPVGTGSLTAD